MSREHDLPAGSSVCSLWVLQYWTCVQCIVIQQKFAFCQHPSAFIFDSLFQLCPTIYHKSYTLEVGIQPVECHLYPRKLTSWPFWPISVWEITSAAETACVAILLTFAWFLGNWCKARFHPQSQTLSNSPDQFKKGPKRLHTSRLVLSADQSSNIWIPTSLKACACLGS